jgi:hypothetical protein
VDISPIRTGDDHRRALVKIEQLWGAVDGTPDGDKLEALITLVEAYEERRWPFKSRRCAALRHQRTRPHPSRACQDSALPDQYERGLTFCGNRTADRHCGRERKFIASLRTLIPGGAP